MSHKNILFRADSSSKIGTGHIMRDLVLAQQYLPANIIFATQDLPGNINHKIKEKNYTIEILNSNDIEEIISLIKKYTIDIIIIDHYDLDYTYEKELKKKTGITILSIDDTYEKHYCDILLNHNVYADKTKYKTLVPSHCELRCGQEYTLIRDEFIEEKKKYVNFKDDQINIFIAMGGADHSNITIEILTVLSNFSGFFANVVTTTANAHLSELEAYVNVHNNIHLHINTDKIAVLMHEANFAILSPSVIVNEAIYMDLPFIAIKTAENQNEMFYYLVSKNYSALEKFNPLELRKALQRHLHG